MALFGEGVVQKSSYDVSKLEYKKIAARRRPSITLGLIGGTKNVGVLVDIHLFQFVAGRSEVFSRIEFPRVVVQDFTNRRRHRQAAIARLLQPETKKALVTPLGGIFF